jgi:hypothetical protein
VVEFGAPVRVDRAEGLSRRELTAQAAEQIRAAMSALVTDASERHGIPLP